MFQDERIMVFDMLKFKSAYEVAKMTGLSTQAITKIKNRGARFENIRLGNFIKLVLLARQYDYDLEGVSFVTDSYGQRKRVDFRGAKVVSTDAKEHRYTVNVPVVDGNNEPTGFYTDVDLIGLV
ncbi:MAG: hypothetical protein D8B54_05955 [Catonella sp.]|nr:MAG: hypothetical protein D8B54_05955 [Catonella sp.]